MKSLKVGKTELTLKIYRWHSFENNIMPLFATSLSNLTMKSDKLCALASTRPCPGGRVTEKPGNEVGALNTWIGVLPKPSTEIFLECYCVTLNEPIKHKIIERYYRGVCSTWYWSKHEQDSLFTISLVFSLTVSRVVHHYLISVSNGLMNGDPLIVCVLTIWSSNKVWISSIEDKIWVPVSR